MAAYVRKDGIVARKVAGETILVPIADNLADLVQVFVLDPVGEFIWEHLGSPSKVAALAAQVAEEFDVDPGKAEADCSAFVRELLDAHLVVEG